MANYFFDTITAAQQAAFTSGDNLVFTGAATATRVSVTYVAAAGASPARIDLTYAGRTISLDPANMAVDYTASLFPDSSRLVIGASAGTDLSAINSSGGDALFGGGGGDTLDGAAGANFMQGNQGDDLLFAGSGPDTVRGGQGADSVDAGDGNNYVHGDLGDDAHGDGRDAHRGRDSSCRSERDTGSTPGGGRSAFPPRASATLRGSS